MVQILVIDQIYLNYNNKQEQDHRQDVTVAPG